MKHTLLSALIIITASASSQAALIGGAQITASTELPVLTNFEGLSFPIEEIDDGIINNEKPWNGFISTESEGIITLDLDQEYDLYSFLLWNDN